MINIVAQVQQLNELVREIQVSYGLQFFTKKKGKNLFICKAMDKAEELCAL
jgi:hypothetical protein